MPKVPSGTFSSPTSVCLDAAVAIDGGRIGALSRTRMSQLEVRDGLELSSRVF